MLNNKLIRWSALSGALLTAVALSSSGGCAASTTPIDDSGDGGDDGSTSSTGGSGAMGGMMATGGNGGAGGESLCDVDCSTISTPDCSVAVCNDGSYQGTVGACVVVDAEDGIGCDDGLFCTTNDTCQAGTCTGGPQNTCGMTPGDCEEIVCDEASGTCSGSMLQNGTPCENSQDLCQVGETCQNGLCVGTPNDCFFQPVPNECHNSVCNPNTGMCEPVPGNDGDPCTGDLCIAGETCAAGVCQGGAPVDCTFLTQGCDLGVCDPMTGMCGTQSVMNGQACDDLSACTTGETCDMGTCTNGTPVTVCEMNGDGCCPNNCDDTNDLDCTVQPSCLGIKTSVPASQSGIYTVDPDLSGPIQQMQVYCDMDQNQGGWTLIARFANADAANWMLDTGEWWYTRIQPSGLTTTTNDNADMISPAFWSVQATEMKITRSDDLGNVGLIVTNQNCMPNTTFRTFITSFGNFQNDAVWGSDSVAGTCPGVLGGMYASTSGFAQATCSGNIGAPNSISFWTDWSSGDGAVMMIGGGGTSCSRADHGIGVTEENAASFGGSTSLEDDFGNNGSSSNNDPYALNLWVR